MIRAEQTLRLFAYAEQLASVHRFSRDRMAQRESVLEHIGFCCFYAMALADRVSSKRIVIDSAKLLRRVVVHDMDEAPLGDVPRTTKYYNADISHEFKRIESHTMNKIVQWLGVQGWFTCWISAKKDDVEGRILRVTDLAAVVYKNWVEVALLGNAGFRRVTLETQHYVDEMIENFTTHGAEPILIEELHNLKTIITGVLAISGPDAHLAYFFNPAQGEQP